MASLVVTIEPVPVGVGGIGDGGIGDGGVGAFAARKKTETKSMTYFPN
jgi:hypothetical protein